MAGTMDDYLASLYGLQGDDLRNALHGALASQTPATVLTTILGVFNNLIVSLVFFVLICVIFLGLVNQASSGHFLAEGDNPLWYVLRTILGLGLLMPVGQNLIVGQVLILTLGGYGINFGNDVWQKAQDVVAKSGLMGPVISEKPLSNQALLQSLFAPVPSFPKDGTQVFTGTEGASLTLLGNVLSCAYEQTNAPIHQSDLFGNEVLPKRIVVTKSSKENTKILFSSDLLGPDDNTCGSFKVLPEYRQALIDFYQKVLKDVQNYQESAPIESNKAVQEQVTQALLKLAENINRIKQKNSALQEEPASRKTPCSNSLEWFMAGGCYLDILGVNNSSGTIVTPGRDIPGKSHEKISLQQTAVDMRHLLFQATKNAIGDLVSDPAVPSSGLQSALNYARNAAGISEVTNFGLNKAVIAKTGSGGMIYLNDLLTNMNDTLDPLSATIQVGANLVNQSIWAMLISMEDVFVGNLTVNVANSFAPAQVIGNLLQTLGNASLMYSGYAFAIGVVCGYLIPIIPLVAFAMVAFGWLLLLAEAIITAPIIVMGVITPSSSGELLSEAQHGIWLLLNVLLRPALIIIGFMVSLFILLFAIRILQLLFFQVLTFEVVNLDLVFGWMVFGAVYVAFLTALTLKSATIIGAIPNRVFMLLVDELSLMGKCKSSILCLSKV